MASFLSESSVLGDWGDSDLIGLVTGDFFCLGESLASLAAFALVALGDGEGFSRFTGFVAFLDDCLGLFLTDWFGLFFTCSAGFVWSSSGLTSDGDDSASFEDLPLLVRFGDLDY